MSESQGRLRVCVNVTGFLRSEIEASVEPRCITILGKRKPRTASTEGAIEQHASLPDQVLQLIDLDTEVDPGQATAKVRAGELIFDLRAAKNDSETAA